MKTPCARWPESSLDPLLDGAGLALLTFLPAYRCSGAVLGQDWRACTAIRSSRLANCPTGLLPRLQLKAFATRDEQEVAGYAAVM